MFERRFLAVLLATLTLQPLQGVAGDDEADPWLTPIPGERLSGWQLRQAAKEDNFPAGLAWGAPSMKPGQSRLKHHLLNRLNDPKGPLPSREVRERIAELISESPVTGRVPLENTDPHWLQAHPEKDPVLDQNHLVRLPKRPKHVTVMASDGSLCPLFHRPGAEAKSYLRACQSAKADEIDTAWVIQPNGMVQTVSVASWNQASQDEPAPGAIIWAPERNSGWNPQFSALFSEFLSTQFPGRIQRTQSLPAQAPGEVRVLLPRARDHYASVNDWGLTGLLQTPGARMMEPGEIRLSYSLVAPYTRANVIMQPLSWLEAGFRYTDVSNRLYGAEIAGTQTYKDKSLDLKIRLAEETATMPAVALGVQDVAGTGLFSSEYLVANKRFGNFDWSLGIAWGYLGNRSNIRNPLSRIFGKSFDSRPGSDVTSQGGEFNFSSYFHGNTSLFGGVQYQTPWDNWIVKVEYDGNDYQTEPQRNNQRSTSPINVGVVYRHSPNLDLSFGVERGNTLMLSFNFHGSAARYTLPKVSESPFPRITEARPVKEPDWVQTAEDLARQTKWSVRQISKGNGEVRVLFEGAQGSYWKDRLDRAAAVLHRDAPAGIHRFIFTFAEHGLSMTERVILRDIWVRDFTRYQLAMERFTAVAAMEPSGRYSGGSVWNDTRSAVQFGLAPNYQQSLGGPDGFILFQAGVSGLFDWRIAESTWLSGRTTLRLLDNYDKFKYDAPSSLPRVRTFIREYLTTSTVTLPNFQLTHVGKLGPNQFYSVYGGALEYMYAGVGAEWLYRPWHSPVAFGVDINRVKQRGFKQDFDLRDYSVNTGHATLYWDTGWKSTHINLSAGQYLAGDKGVTVEANKTFPNGVSFGIWATKTNVSAVAFGEGSFDKGIYVRIPFDVILPVYSPSTANLVWNPLTRDGGAKLDRAHPLYNMTSSRDRRVTKFAVPSANGPLLELEDERYLWGSSASFFDDIGASASGMSKQVKSLNLSQTLLYGGGIVLGASLLDKPLATWASKHQSNRWNQLGKMASAIPYALAAGAGVLWLGAGGEIAADTAWAAIKSAAATAGAETLIKYGVGRKRPDANLGPGHFESFSGDGVNSSFPSLQTGVAFALVTPFAQRFDAPWLYAIAGATSFGRIQQQQHFASDVVAGGLIGFGIGTMMLEQHQQKRGRPQLIVGQNREVRAIWEFE